MDELAAGLDPDELMDLDEAEGSELDDDDEELIDDPIPSPFPFPSSGPASTATSAASSPPNNDDISMPFNFSGKPLNIKRGRGRPRREGGKPAQRRQGITNRIKKVKPPGYVRGAGRKFKTNFDRGDFDLSCITTPSPSDEISMIDPETGALIFTTEREKPMPVFEDLPYFPEQWPGKVCAFCNLGEKSQLGQGEMLRLVCPEGFIPQRVASNNDPIENPNVSSSSSIPTPERDAGDKSPRGPVTCRRQKSFNKCRHPSLTSEYVDELTIIGYTEEPDISALFDSGGYFYTHRSCALWSNGVTKNDDHLLENVGPAVLQSSSKKCSLCNHYGASISCKVDGCVKVYHFPCATASGAFQILNTLLLYCSTHLGQASLECEFIMCYSCKSSGNITNLMYCSSCGEHYHGICVGLAQLPGVRAGWQCRKCRICQVCRVAGDESKLMTCEQCDKIYHSTCQRPIVTSIPKYGWKCRCCRVCGDCGSRTPGAGLSSRWHSHYTVCDSCYQQRNKGFYCPICSRAYRAHAHREMVQCTSCKKFVHGTCDTEADLVTYHQKKEAHPEYEYVCFTCKANKPGQLVSKRSSIEDLNECLSTSQDLSYDDVGEFDPPYSMDTFRNMGLGKGKPYSASKIAKKRLGMPGRPKGVGKGGIPGKVGFMKRQKLPEFGRKRGPKAKMRGVFGVPGVGLQRPVADGSKSDDEPGIENRLVLCSAKDKFVLTQDICVMCGALGTDQEGCLISCVQCGQCYHPYCVNVKVTKVILEKGWRCLDCTVCEGCGQRNDEGRLLLCDECDISYHIYCMDPPLEYVPHGNWKCKWCAICQTCGATDPGFNCTWMNSFSECGPCASHVNCPSCTEPYGEGDLIIQCVQCERWLHGHCDNIKTEDDAEKCAEDGYNCLLCRPRDVPPPHLVPSLTAAMKPPTPTKSPEVKSNNNYFVDGVYLSEAGNNLIKSLSFDQHGGGIGTRKKRKKLPTVQDKEAGIMATIESVVADEPQELYKEGMIWMKDDGAPPEGFTLFTMETGVSVLRRKRQRNLQKLGIGGFLVRMRGTRSGNDNDDIDVLPGQSSQQDLPMSIGTTMSTTTTVATTAMPQQQNVGGMVDGDKPRRKPIRRKLKSKLAETFPPYLQEAFFGKDLMETTKEIDSSSSDEEKSYSDMDKTIQLTQDEIKAVAAVTTKSEVASVDSTKLLMDRNNQMKKVQQSASSMQLNQTAGAAATAKEEEEDDNTEDLKDVLTLPGDLLDTELVNTIMNEGDLAKQGDNLDALTGTNLPDDTDITQSLVNATNAKDTKDELSDILGPHFNLEAMPNINSKDVEDIFKGVLTDDSQESQESNVFPLQPSSAFGANPQPQINQHVVAVRPTTLSNVNQGNINSPSNFPPQSPYQSEYSNSPQFSPAFSEPPSPWVSVNENPDLETAPTGVPSTYNQRSSEKMKADEGLGNGATISAVLYANMNHPEWKVEFPNWNDRYKQILKKWRTLSSEQKAPYLQQARDNRSALRMKKQQQSQMNKEQSSNASSTSTVAAAAAVASATANAPINKSSAMNNSNITSSQIVLGGAGVNASASSTTTIPATTTTVPTNIINPTQVSEDQEKVPLQLKSAREAEQERQWKQLQAIRQQQAQQHQNVIQEQRVQAIARVQRQISDPTQPFSADQSPQELSPVTSPGPNAARQMMGLKSPTFTHPVPIMRPPLAQSTPPDFATADDPYAKPPLTPKPPPPPTQQQQPPPNFANRMPIDPYAQQPGTPRPQFPISRSNLQALNPAALQQLRQDPNGPQPQPPQSPAQQPPEMNRQLRELLQFKKLDDHSLAGKGQQRVWPPVESAINQDPAQQQQQQNVAGETNQMVMQNPGDVTFRQPLPPSAMRPRLPMNVVGVPRQQQPQQGNILGMRIQQLDPRMQVLDSRARFFIQQQRLLQQQQQQQQGAQQIQQQQQLFQGGTVRFVSGGGIRPTSVEQYEQLLQQQQQQRVSGVQPLQQQFQPRVPGDQIAGQPRMVLNQMVALQRPQLNQVVAQQNVPAQQPAQQSNLQQQLNQPADNSATEQEIPDNVTAELEKLEQETGTMVELHGVGDILGGLGDDDDELLAEMGADFNILEYADPEALPGEKTNILDLELEEEPIKNEKKVKVEIPKSQPPPPTPPTPQIAQQQQQQPQLLSQPQIKKEVVVANQQSLVHVQQHHQQQQQQQQQQQSPANVLTALPPPTLPNNNLNNSIHPPPLAISQNQQSQLQQQQQQHTLASSLQQQQQQQATNHLTPQQIHQQMLIQVQQAAAHGKPMLPGSKLQTPDGFIGIVTSNNNVQLQVPPNYNQRILVSPLQNPKLQMRLSQNVPRMLAGPQLQQGLQPGPIGVGPRMASGPPPPPPPYPGPPPPYPGSSTSQQQMGLRMGPVHLPLGHIHPMRLQGLHLHPHLQRRPLLLEEQPLLLEDLLEQEKREQEKQNQNQQTNHDLNANGVVDAEPALLSDHDFERLKADVFSNNTMPMNTNNRPGQQVMTPNVVQQQQQQVGWQPQQQTRPAPPTPQPIQETPRVQTFNANLLPPPPLPPENIATEQDKQKQIVYEQWLTHQNNVLSQQLRYYETEVNKLRKLRKSLNSKQRQLKKTGSQLADADANELQRVSSEQSILQKHLESSRKLVRQHGLLIQEYRNKQQAKQQRPGPGQSPLLMQQQNHSPLGPPSSSPIHHSTASQSPMMSPSASPLTQHNSPMHSPSPMISHSPGPGSVQNILQSPNSLTGSSMSPMQPSPRIGTPHSQGDGSPGPVQSPSSQVVCPPPPAPRMTSPQHKRVVTSPVGYTGEIRPGTPQMRFVRAPLDTSGGAVMQQRVARLTTNMMGYQQQKPGSLSPLNSPPPSQQMNLNQALLQKQLQQQQQQQVMTIDQQQQQVQQIQQQQQQTQDPNLLNSQRTAQLIQQRQFLRQQMAAQQAQAQGINQPQPLTPQQHQMMVQQQQQLAKQQQQMVQMQAQLRLNQQQQQQQQVQQQINTAPSSPMPPKSPLVGQQIMSPHSMPQSPMPPQSPMMQYANTNQQATPNSPVARNQYHQNMNQPPSSPMTMQQQYQPPSSPMPRSPMVGPISSPMGMRRPPSANSSPAMPDRPTSVDPTMQRPTYSNQSSVDSSNGNNMMMESAGGGNANNPIPAPACFGRYGYFKLGLRGGAPMWGGFGRGAKRIPTPPVGPNKEGGVEKAQIATSSESATPPPVKPKKESHLSKVSILKRKSPAKTNLQSLAVSKVGSLVSTDYNEFDDSSCTPPVTPPPTASTSRVQKTTIGKKIQTTTVATAAAAAADVAENKEIQVMIVHSDDEKQLRCEELMDYDDENNTVISGEVSLSSAAQHNDVDDIAVIETFSQSDLGEAMSSPLESDQNADEYILFPGNVVDDLTNEAQYSDKEEEDYSSENMHVVIRSPTTSDDEFIMQNKMKKYNIRGLQSNHLLNDNPDSPETEDIQLRSESIDDDGGYEESEIVIIDPSLKLPDEQIATKEDFEVLIDEGTRKDKVIKPEVITAKISEIHKYAANYSIVNKKSSEKESGTSTSGLSSTSTTPPTVVSSVATTTTRVSNLKLGPKISLITTPVLHNLKTVSRADGTKLSTENVATLSQNAKIILQNAVRSNVLTVPKLVTSGSPSAITIVSASQSPIASILAPGVTVPVISASAVRQLPNVKVIDKPSSSTISIPSHDNCLPKKIFEDDSVSPDSSNCGEDKSKELLNEDKQKQEIVKAEIKPEIKMEKEDIDDKLVKKVEEIKEKDVKIVEVKSEVKSESTSNSSPAVQTKCKSPVIIHNPPELKMTAQVIQESQSGMQITARTETIDGYEDTSGEDTKSVVISIPSPTPSQEQMLDNIALQALEHRRRDGNVMTGEFDTIEDMLDMIENITGDPPTAVLDENNKTSLNEATKDLDKTMLDLMETESKAAEVDVKTETTTSTKTTTTVTPPSSTSVTTTNVETPPAPINVSNIKTSSTVPQLSPLSQPADLTTNMANASQQLRSLLSLHTTVASSSTGNSNTSVENIVKCINNKIVTTNAVQRALQQQVTTASSLGAVLIPNLKQKTVMASVLTTKTVPIRTTMQNQTIANILTQASMASNMPIATTLSLIPSRSGALQLMTTDHSKLTRVTFSAANVVSSQQQQQQKPSATPTTTAVAVSTTLESENRKTTCSLTEMLQSHPAAVPTSSKQADTITAASLLGTSLALSRSISTSLVQAQPNVVVSPATSNPTSLILQTVSQATSSAMPSTTTVTATQFKAVTTTTNLLHTQLTKVMRSKSTEESGNASTPPQIEQQQQQQPIKTEDIKQEHVEVTASEEKIKQEPLTTSVTTSSGCKYLTLQTQQQSSLMSRSEDSQNALLKKLLQNTGCASTQTPPPNCSVAPPITVAAAIPFTASNLELKVSSTPTLSSILPSTTKEQVQQQQQQQVQVKSVEHQQQQQQRAPIMLRETSFVSSPTITQQMQHQQQQNMQQQPQIPQQSPSIPTQQLHIDVKKCMPPSRTPSRDDLLSPPTPRSSCSQDSSLQTPPLVVKKEMGFPQQQQQMQQHPQQQQLQLHHQGNLMMSSQDVKKEFVDESSQHSNLSDHSRSDVQMKEEIDGFDPVNEKMLLDHKEELKKQKRRMYQQKRRQNQIMNKEAAIGGQPKKRPRKNSKVEEDYDTYIDGVLAQLRTLPPMVVAEPVLNRNFSILPVFGSDLSKLAAHDYDSRYGELKGEYGNASMPGYSDFYNTQPYGDAEQQPEKPPASTQRGFYDQEFPLIKFDSDEDKRFDQFCREDSPDSIVSSSSPEGFNREDGEPAHRFLGLKLIDEDDDDDDDEQDGEVDLSKMRLSPVVPLIAPIPIRLKPNSVPYLKDYADDKENVGRELCMKSKFASTPTTPLKDSGNVTVTLTLTSSAAEDIMGVLRDLANILHIPAPTSYQIVERTSTPPSQKLGLYRTKGKDGKEGAPIDIQSILNGAAKFCKHCDVVILNNMIRKKVSELSFLAKDSELLSDGDELFFCSTTCYMQFALMHRSPSIPEDKAAAIINHLCQKDNKIGSGKTAATAMAEPKKHFIENMEMELHCYKRDGEIGGDVDVKSAMFAKSVEKSNKKLTDEHQQPTVRQYRGLKYKIWAPGCLQPASKHKKASDKEIMELLYRLGITVTPAKIPEDTRKCMFCQTQGDGVADGPARLLNFDVDKWVHLNCGLWSDGVYETVNGALMNLETALQQSLTQTCVHCNSLGATIRCFKTRCSNVYHLSCAVKDGCVFYKNKTTYCTVHVPKNEKDNELTTLSVSRRVYVNRDENRQVAAVMHHSDANNLLRVGSLIFLNVGQILPHQLQNFHTPNYIYPIGYKIIRFYWSMRRVNKRCRYVCSIHDVLGRPEFRVLIQEPPDDDLEFKDNSPKAVWQKILDRIAEMRIESQCVQVFPKFISGEDLFGLSEPAITRVLESLPGVETLTDYKFKYGRNPLLELPLAINPSGAARTEPRLRNQLHWKRPHTQRTGGSTRPVFGPSTSLSNNSSLGEVACPYSKQFVHSKSSQYKKMKQEWRNNVYLARSKIQGLGLYAARDLEKHTMVIEYIGEIIRTELAETREKKYEAKNRGIYMFRLDEERVVDATLCGGLARYINHSCNPNCVAETVEVDRDYRIIIFAKRRIQRGEELAYDYKFDIEDDQHKISCMCGAPNCRKWMN